MGGRASKPDPAPPPLPSEQQLKDASDAIKAKGGEVLKPDSTWELKEERTCTDCLFWLVFLIFQAACIVIAGFGFAYGDPQRLIYGYDSNGNTCGRPTGGNFNKSFLYYPYPISAKIPTDYSTMDASSLDTSWAVCLETCPYQLPSPAVSYPNTCSISFKIMVDNSKIITCGGPQHQTDLSQFYDAYNGVAAPALLAKMTGINGFLQWCTQYNPVCLCPGGNQTMECCDGINPQAFDNGFNPPKPVVRKLNDPKSLFGITMGHTFGFCFIPYPSASSSFTTRCMPVMPGTPTLDGTGTQGAARTVAQAYASSLNSIVDNQNAANKVYDSKSTPIAPIDPATVSLFLGKCLDIVIGFVGDSQATFTSLCAEVYQNCWVIMGSALLALLLSLLYTQLLRFFAKTVCIVMLALSWVLLAMCTAVLGYKAGIINTNSLSQTYQGTNPNVPGDSFSLTPSTNTTIGQAQTNSQLLIIATVVVGVTFVAYSCILCVMFRRLMLAAEVVSEAGRCVAAMPLVLFFPIVQWIFIAAYFVWFVILFLYLASAGNFNTTTRKFEWNEQVRKCLILHMFGMLWARATILAAGNMIVAGATGQWFLAPQNSPANSPMLASTWRTVRYHLGTVYIGSAIIATIQFFRFVVQAYLYGVSRANEGNSVVAAMKVLAECCLACMERFFDFVNKNAFIQTALEGTSFCTSAWNAFQLLFRNALRLAAISGISTVFLWIGKLFVATFTGFVCALIIMGGDINNVTQAPLFSVTIIMLMAFAISSAFMDAWEIIIDTLFQCFCMDEEKGSGKTHLSLKNFVADNKPKAKDLNMITSRAPPKPAAKV